MAELNVDLCRELWERYRTSEIEPDHEVNGVTVRCWRPQAVSDQDSESGKASFLGYGDFTLRDDLGFAFKVRSLEAKILKGRIYLDFPSEKSPKKDAEGKPIYFPRMLTKTFESRDIMTKLFFRDPRVKAQADAAIVRWNERQGATAPAADGADGADEATGHVSDDNPF